MHKEDLYVGAYERIKSIPENMTPGTDEETLDGFSLELIREIIHEMFVLLVAHPKEALKDLLVFLRGDANAKILHADGGGIRVRGKLDPDGIGMGRIFHSRRAWTITCSSFVH